MYKHRVAFVGVWLLGAIALLLYPGFESRGLVMGLIIGYWPIYLLGALIGDAVLPAWDLIIPSMFLLSAAEVGFCAWLMDKAKIDRTVWLGLLVTIVVGGTIAFNLHAGEFDSYKASPWVMAAEGSPELNYEFTLSEFYRICLIPNMIVGGLLGLYLTAAVSGLYGAGVLVFAGTRPANRMHAAVDSGT